MHRHILLERLADFFLHQDGVKSVLLAQFGKPCFSQQLLQHAGLLSLWVILWKPQGRRNSLGYLDVNDSRHGNSSLVRKFTGLQLALQQVAFAKFEC